MKKRVAELFAMHGDYEGALKIVTQDIKVEKIIEECNEKLRGLSNNLIGLVKENKHEFESKDSELKTDLNIKELHDLQMTLKILDSEVSPVKKIHEILKNLEIFESTLMNIIKYFTISKNKLELIEDCSKKILKKIPIIITQSEDSNIFEEFHIILKEFSLNVTGLSIKWETFQQTLEIIIDKDDEDNLVQESSKYLEDLQHKTDKLEKKIGDLIEITKSKSELEEIRLKNGVLIIELRDFQKMLENPNNEYNPLRKILDKLKNFVDIGLTFRNITPELNKSLAILKQIDSDRKKLLVLLAI
jgi:hypothetical protein